jgi:hypothetical protein
MDRPTGRKIACLLGCPDENDPARLCIAYDGDELAPCDVRSMRDALERHGFKTHVVPRDRKRETEVVAYVQDLFADCDRSDEVVFYFSGHGRIPDREFELALSPTESITGYQLLRELRRCRARDKLLILDCCYAGAIEELTRLFPEQSLDLRVLVAAHGLQIALHDPAVYGSYFSHFLCEALTNPSLWCRPSAGGLVDPLGNLDSNALILWLQERVRAIAERRARLPTAIPTPLAFPRLPQGFTVLRLNLDQPLGYPQHYRHTLRAAIVESGISVETAAASYAWCASRQSGSALPEPETVGGLPDILDCLLDQARFYLAGDALKLPLLSFVAHLNHGLPDAQALDRWQRAALAWLYERGERLPIEHINEAQRIDRALPAARAQTQRPPCLLIEVAPANPPLRGYQVSWDAIDAKGETRRKADRGTPVGHADLPAAIAAILPTALGASRGARIELALPAALLADDGLIDRLERLHCWDGVDAAPDAGLKPGQLAHERPFVLRCWERWGSTERDAERYGGWRLREHWQDRGDCLGQPPTQPCLAWIGPGADPVETAKRLLLAPRRGQRPLALGLHATLGADRFESLLGTGAPILLWPRRAGPTASDATDLERDFQDRCGDRGLAYLPRALHEHRCCPASAAAACAGTDALSLLWDTPDLLKYDQPPDDPDLMFEAPL